MPIISISLDETSLKELDEVQRELSFPNRSDTIRAAIKFLEEEMKSRKSMKGKLTAVVLASHHQKKEDKMKQSVHDFEDIIKTNLHTNLGNKDCLEIFIVEGEAERINQFLLALQQKKPARLKLIIP
ncbi:MAG: CopG family ribbon-helix-helix protein [Candidatus Anstonellaceae archaeon]